MSDYRAAAALVLGDHLFRVRDYAANGQVIGGSCACHEWVGTNHDHSIHLAEVLDQAGLLSPLDLLAEVVQGWLNPADVEARRQRTVTRDDPDRLRVRLADMQAAHATWPERCPSTRLPYPDAPEQVRCVHGLDHERLHEAYWPSRGVVTW